MHPILMPLVVATFMGNPMNFQAAGGDGFRTQVQPRILMLDPTLAHLSAPVARFSTDSLRPEWSGKVGEYNVTLRPRKESGGFKIDLQIDF